MFILTHWRFFLNPEVREMIKTQAILMGSIELFAEGIFFSQLFF